MSADTTRKAKARDLLPDPKNANKGTARGLAMLDDSLRKYGAGRSILVDKNGNVIAGNKTLERAVDVGIEDVIMVPSDGKQLIAVQRTDIDLDTPQGRSLAIADNRVGEVDLDWDAEALAALANEGVKLEEWWDEGELGQLLNQGEELDYDKMWQGMPEYQNQNLQGIFITVHFANLEDKAEFFKKIGQPGTETTRAIWYPERPEAIKNQLGRGMIFTDES